MADVQFSFLCDYADQGAKLTAVGIGIDTIFATDVPAVHPLFFAVISIRFNSTEVGEKRLGIRVVDADGNNVIPPIDGSVKVERIEGYTYSNQRVALALNGVEFQKFGDYAVAWLLEGNEINRVPFRVASPAASV